MKRAVIICREQKLREELVELLKANFTHSLRIVAVESNEFQAARIIKSSNPEIVIYSPQLTHVSGKAFSTCFPAQEIAWIPIDEGANGAELKEVARRIGQLFQTSIPVSNDWMLLLNLRRKKLAIQYADIVRAKAEGNYTRFFTVDGCTYFISRNLYHYQKMLGTSFYRIHHSHLINFDRVRIYDSKSGMVELSNGDTLPVARRRRKSFCNEMRLVNKVG